jgi:hypothetical protein
MLISISAEVLAEDFGLSVETHVCKNLGHDINQESFDTACDFAEKSLGIKSAPAQKPVAKKARSRRRLLKPETGILVT